MSSAIRFPFSMDSAPAFPEAPPEACDVVVIGGGIVGVMTAWFLARRGLKTALCEKGRIAGEQSSRNWGWIRQQGRDPHELPIMVEANRIWRELAEECGERLGFRQTGILYLANSERELAQYEDWLPHAQHHGVDSRLLSGAEVANLLPEARLRWPGGLYTPSDARAEPWLAVPTLAHALSLRPRVSLHEGCAARALDTEAGQISGVITEQGRIRCQQVVLAGGAWSSMLARAHGVDFPQLAVKSTVGATEPLPEVLAGGVAEEEFAVRRRQDGGYTLAHGTHREMMIGPDAFRHFKAYLPLMRGALGGTGFHLKAPPGFPDAWGTPRRWSPDRESPFERQRILNPTPNPKLLDQMANRFHELFPQLPRPTFQKAWAGMIDTMPDTVPIIDRIESLPGLVVATGMSGHGFGIGPAVGRVVADLAAGKDPGHDLSRFRSQRFARGQRIEVSPAF